MAQVISSHTDDTVRRVTEMIEEYRSSKESAKEQILANLERVIDRTHRRPRMRLTSNKPLYELAREALIQLGKKARTKDVVPVLREKSGRYDLTPILTYQALEYGRKAKGNIKRFKGGVWRAVETRVDVVNH